MTPTLTLKLYETFTICDPEPGTFDLIDLLESSRADTRFSDHVLGCIFLAHATGFLKIKDTKRFLCLIQGKFLRDIHVNIGHPFCYHDGGYLTHPGVLCGKNKDGSAKLYAFCGSHVKPPKSSTAWPDVIKSHDPTATWSAWNRLCMHGPLHSPHSCGIPSVLHGNILLSETQFNAMLDHNQEDQPKVWQL